MIRPVAAGGGAFVVEHENRLEVVFVAGRPGDWWAFWNGNVYRGSFGATAERDVAVAVAGAPHKAEQALAAPMPATVVKVLVAAGAEVKKGEALVILEAMKMELPLRAPSDARVTAVHCREGELVQPDTVLVELA